MMGLGLPNGSIIYETFLDSAKYKIKTGAGISDAHFTCEYGTGQRIGWSPLNWSSVSDIISNLMEYVPGMTLIDPVHLEQSTRKFDAYVDDVNGGATNMAWKDFSGNAHVALK